ncbi:MAG: DUF2281 domain-containing protein [Candidatus Handelsmanbacteria bacterium RIFCSPLOWO2_12_FULL_64_10]|uniref:DUF2281 domain-containing protein n=1 Tax=Handelsmanbacteria sp. (strain RIFCSPLOWO2_12_FULL_64_10) TaxID=1817868 RepID=A0A1F6CLM1_HANXR|nr:MAG: DUF2281 domain-containing protein [Candidatus Handelsmanbacteria bacterium RIFCSPLOWO2_12_FULL_64_10]
MNQKKAWQLFSDLPPEAQRQVTDFIAFLKMRYAPSHPHKTAKQTKLTKEAFIGMWRDREDLQDSSAWVRKVREREWGQHRE